MNPDSSRRPKRWRNTFSFERSSSRGRHRHGIRMLSILFSNAEPPSRALPFSSSPVAMSLASIYRVIFRHVLLIGHSPYVIEALGAERCARSLQVAVGRQTAVEVGGLRHLEVLREAPKLNSPRNARSFNPHVQTSLTNGVVPRTSSQMMRIVLGLLHTGASPQRRE